MLRASPTSFHLRIPSVLISKSYARFYEEPRTVISIEGKRQFIMKSIINMNFIHKQYAFLFCRVYVCTYTFFIFIYCILMKYSITFFIHVCVCVCVCMVNSGIKGLDKKKKMGRGGEGRE